MKKLSVLVMLILCITIGGVYATWIYTSSTISSVDRTISHGLESVNTDGDVGVFKIEANNINVAIDQTAEGDYTAKLVITGQITVRFTPNPGAPEDVVNNAVSAHATLYTKNADVNKYNGSEIYVSPEGAEVDLVWEKQADGSFLATLTAADIDTLLDLGGTFVLDTHQEYLDFHALEENITLTVLFSQK